MVLTAAVLMQSVMTFAILAPLIVAPVVLEALSVPASWAGFYAPIAFSSAAVVSIYSGALLKHVGPWRLSIACLCIAACGMAVFGFATPLAMAVGGVIVGVGYGPITGAGASIVVRSRPANLSLAMSVRQTGVPLGASLGGFLLPPLTNAFGWEGACFLAAAAMLAAALLSCCLSACLAPERSDRPGSGSAIRMRPFHLVATDVRLRRLAVVTVTFAALQNCFTSFLSLYLVDHMHRSLVVAGLMLGISQILAMLARVVWGALADRTGPLAVLGLLGFSMAAASIVIGSLWPGAPTSVLLGIVIVFGATVTGWNGIVLAQSAKLVSPPLGGAVTGEIAAFAYIGFVVGPPVFSAIAEASDLRCGFIAAGALCAASTLVIVLGARKER